MAFSMRVKRGLEANLPTSAPKGELLYCTDSNKLFVGTGTSIKQLTVTTGDGWGYVKIDALAFTTGTDNTSILAGVIPFTSKQVTIDVERDLFIEANVYGQAKNSGESADIYFELSSDGGTTWTKYDPYDTLPTGIVAERGVLRSDGYDSTTPFVFGKFSAGTYDIRLSTSNDLSLGEANHNLKISSPAKTALSTRSIAYYIHETLKTETNAVSFIAPQNLTIREIHLAVDTAPTGADLIVDCNNNGTSIVTSANRPTILDGATSGSQNSIASPSVVKGDKISLDIDQVGSTERGANLAVTIICSEA